MYGHDIGLPAGAGAVFGRVVGGLTADGFTPAADFGAGVFGLDAGGVARFSISASAGSCDGKTSCLSRAP